MQPSEIALIFDHLYWVRDRILDAASAPGVTWPGTAPDGLLDLRATLVHELDVEWSWRQRLTGPDPTAFSVEDEELVPDDFPSVASIRERWTGDEMELRAWLASLSAKALDGAVRRGGVAEPPAVVAPPAPLHPRDPAAQQRRLAAERRRPFAGRARLPRVRRVAGARARMKVGVMLPVGDGDAPGGRAIGWDDVRDVALATEAAGLDSGWLADHLLYQNEAGETVGMLDAWTLLSALATVTSRIDLGPLVLCASFRHPSLVANMATTLDHVSDGRLVLGVGAGWHQPEYDAFGYPFDHRVGRFAEHLEILARLVRGERVTFDGEYSQVHDAALAPPPLHRIPILVAAEGPRMLGLAARWADAWITAWYAQVSDELRTTLRAFDAAMAEAGRPTDEVERIVGITVRDPDQPPVPEPEVAIEGSIDDVARALDAYRDLGLAQVIVGLEPINVRSVERLAAAVRLHRGGSASSG